PVQHRADEERLQRMGLGNYWGYTTIGWFAPEARYWSGRPGSSPAGEFRAMADAVHARGMEVVIDVVYNHSAETDELGPTLSLRGVDNALYYRLRQDDRALYENWTGCGNCLDFREPRVVQLAMDSLRFWMNELGVDGFRFDLAPILARTGGPASERFDPRAPFLAAIAQDPTLSRALLIAEPWDIGPDGYCLGRFPAGWLEWNDRFRDTQRSFWLHAGAGRGEFAHRLLASSGDFDRGGRAPCASVNFVTAHDGFTLRDLVSYDERHNLANGEGNRDGSSSNHSRNFGVEGDTDDPAVQTARRRAQRTLLAALMFSQGTPMILAGDEIGHTQRGNNNAYCQDNETTWLPWDSADAALTRYVARLATLRRRAVPLRRADWWPSAAQHGLRWIAPEGHLLDPAEWQRADTHALALLFDIAPSEGGDRWLLLVNADAHDVTFTLPPGRWLCELASDEIDQENDPDDGTPLPELSAQVQVPSRSLWLARSEAQDGATLTNPDPSTHGGDRT
ncbi:MAG: glycogen debranching enzyme GlgX, partial [Gammaproteobacteria bacterium]|nr:glycogen debranching enzyme GlgX [Gammaproteobacteria bacterium]